MAVAVVCVGAVLQVYVYGPVPPMTVAEALPPTVQPALLKIAVVMDNGFWLTVTVAVTCLLQLLASFTVTVYVPAGTVIVVLFEPLLQVKV